MRKAVRAVIVKDDQMLVMKRNKFGQEYYTLVGGGIDFGEEPLHSLVREIKEEASLEVQNPKLIFVEQAGDPYGTQYIYLCEYVDGEPKLADDSDEAKISKDSQNLYQTMWLPIKDLKTAPFLSEILKRALLKGFEKGWPDQPLALHSEAEVRYTDTTKNQQEAM